MAASGSPSGRRRQRGSQGFQRPSAAGWRRRGANQRPEVKGSSTVLKQGTKVKSIRLVGGDHEVDCKMDGGSFMLKPAT